MKKKTPQNPTSGFIQRLTRIRCGETPWLIGALTLLAAALSAPAGSFSANFNSGSVPTNSAVYGNAYISTGGISNTDCLHLTDAANSQQGSFVITPDLDQGTPVVSFTAQFKALFGGGSGANGFSFNFAPDVPLDSFGEDGVGTGLSIPFDSYQDVGESAPGIRIAIGGSGNVYIDTPMNLDLDTWVDVFVQYNSDTTVTVIYNGVYAVSNYSTGWVPPAGSIFGFGGRTGAVNDNHWIDNLTISTQTNAQPYVSGFTPGGNAVRGDSPITVLLSDNYSATQINPATVLVNLDGTNVAATVSQSEPITSVIYNHSSLFASGSSHNVIVTYSDSATNNYSFSWGFTVGTYSTLPTNLIASPSMVSANPGFDITYSQISVDLGPTIQRAENQLAGLLVDPTTGQPYINTASPNGGPYTYVEANVINYDYASGNVPGLPGINGDYYNYAAEAVSYLYLTNGVYTLGVASSDGFNLTVASTPDVFALDETNYNGVRSPAGSNSATFVVAQTGYYPFRILFFTGGIEQVSPSAGTPHLEFYSQDAFGNITHVNDSSQPGYIQAFQPAATVPYVQSISPTASQVGVQRNAAVTARLIDGSITVQPNTVQLQVNGTVVPPTVSHVSGVTTVTYQPPVQFLPHSAYTNQLAFTDSSGHRRTNTWTFTTANVFNQMWVITPANSTNATWASWVTTGSTERGIAYNPTTGHVLLVSRSAATGANAPNGLGIGVFNGTNGQYITQLAQGSGIISDGTYLVNMIGVADDGVIYVCNLTTSTAHTFAIYSWQNESATPTVAFRGTPQEPNGDTPRWGDSFAVRGAGVGTQMIAYGNNGSANAFPLFTTPDGTNFNYAMQYGPSIGANILTNNWAHLGVAFGCGNTCYGLTTSSPLFDVAFNGPSGTNATVVSEYAIVDAANTKEDMGPIGVDIVNQRVVADVSSISPHAMELYDLNALTTNGFQSPVDTAPFSSSVSSFGTGAISFSPDGALAYTLDTANGIQAFNMAPEVASPTICSEPQSVIATLGAGAYFGVGAIGGPQSIQWYLNGAVVTGATSRSLAINNVQTNQLGSYTVVISNATLHTSATSSPALLDTQMGIATAPASQQVSPGGTATFTVAVTNGLPAYHYQWELDGVDVGGNSPSYTVNNAQSATAGNYTVVITDSLGQSISSSATLSITGAPQIVTDIQPSSLVMPVGNTAVFTVSATGPGTLTYQWFVNGSKLTDNSRVSGSLTSALTIANAQLNDSGSYQLMISNSVGYIYSSAAPLTVTLITFNNGAGWTANGNAIINNGTLALTEGSTSQNSSFWLNEQVDIMAFRASWVYQDTTGGAGANGMVFVVQNSTSGTSALGAGGGQIGYQGITPSVGLGFNIYPNYTIGIQLVTNFFTPPFSTPGLVNLAGGDPIGVTVQYTGGVMSVTLTDSVAAVSFSTNYSINVTNVVGSSLAYVGITGSAGGVASSQIVSNFLFTSLVTLGVQNAGGGSLILTWPTGTPGLLLQQNTSLNPSGWVNSTTATTVVNGQNQVTVSPSGKTEFYRLSTQ